MRGGALVEGGGERALERKYIYHGCNVTDPWPTRGTQCRRKQVRKKHGNKQPRGLLLTSQETRFYAASGMEWNDPEGPRTNAERDRSNVHVAVVACRNLT